MAVSESVRKIEKVITGVDAGNPSSESRVFPVHIDYYKALFKLCGKEFDSARINEDPESRLLLLGMQESMVLFAKYHGGLDAR